MTTWVAFRSDYGKAVKRRLDDTSTSVQMRELFREKGNKTYLVMRSPPGPTTTVSVIMKTKPITQVQMITNLTKCKSTTTRSSTTKQALYARSFELIYYL